MSDRLHIDWNDPHPEEQCPDTSLLVLLLLFKVIISLGQHCSRSLLHCCIPITPLSHAGTTITTALTCTRRAWLSERFAAAGGGPSAAALRGTLLHELLQRLLVEVVGDDSGADLPGLQRLQDMVSLTDAVAGMKACLLVPPMRSEPSVF